MGHVKDDEGQIQRRPEDFVHCSRDHPKAPIISDPRARLQADPEQDLPTGAGGLSHIAALELTTLSIVNVAAHQHAGGIAGRNDRRQIARDGG